MKLLTFVLLLANITLYSQSIKLIGKVIESESGKELAGANVFIADSDIGTATNLDGKFILEGSFSSKDSIVVSHLGYEKYISSISDFQKSNHIVLLVKSSVTLEKTIVIQGLLAKEGVTPVSFSKVTRKDIQNDYTMQDIPEYLSYLPSTTFYSDNGNGIGYNYISIRGFGQRRISISVNGIPQNDPEDHNVYWLDMPDLLESTEVVQVQRGAGAGIIGYPSIGGSINIVTSPFSNSPIFELSSSIGSYNTRKYSAKYSSGLINNKYSLYAKLSKTLSDGYRDNSWINFNSYHVSAARYDKNLTTIINIFGGPVSDGLAYYGLPKSFIKDKKLRKTNFLTKDEIENFSQPHYELLNDWILTDNLKLNSSLFLVTGEGFFDYDGSWSIYYDDYFRLKENNFSSGELPTNALIRAQVENKQWGWIPRLTWEHDNGTLILGAEYRNHRSLHWGAIKFAENLPVGLPRDYKYYQYKGGKNIINSFINENYNITDDINILGEIQLSYHKYKLFDEKYLDNDISTDGLYLNPRLGFNYGLNERVNWFVSFARVTREPRLKNYYDAAESSGGAVPQFEQLTGGSYNFENPLVKPEKMHDIELGARYADKSFAINTNLFYMLFNDEIISKGQLDRFGQPITGNIDKTIHMGVEIDGSYKFNSNLSLIFNASYSSNFVSKGFTFIQTVDNAGNDIVKELSLKDNKIAGFPELTMNAIIRGNIGSFFGQLSAKYVGEYFSDNYDTKLSTLLVEYPDFVSYTDNKVESFVVLNFSGSYKLSIPSTGTTLKVFAQVNNIFDNLYATYATGGDFFPAAERNFIVGLKLGI